MGVKLRFRDGLGWGARISAVYVGYVLVLALLRGNAPFGAADTSLAAVILGYCLGGLLGGLAFGLFLPLAATWLGSALLGFLVAFPVFVAIGIANDPVAKWGAVPGTAAGIAGVVGPICGVAMFFLYRYFRARIRGG